MPKEIKSPDDAIAKKEMVIIEEANVRIKELIVGGAKDNIPKEQIEKQIKKLIDEYASQIPNIKTREMFISGIKASAQRWYMIYKETIRNATLITMAQLTALGIKANDISVSYSSEDKFRPYVSNDPKGLPIIENYKKIIREGIGTLVHDNPTSIIYTKNGPKRASLRNEAEIQARFEANAKDIDSMVEDGVNLVITTTHADCSKRCQKYQGKIFTLQDTPLKINGKTYKPLKWAMLGDNNDGNGIISGYNCRHRAIEYTPGMVMPTEYSVQEIKKRREVNSKQRYMERTIRGLKVQERLLRQQGDNKSLELAKKARLSWRKKQTAYKIYSLENGNSYEEWRCRISNNEKDQIIETDKELEELRNENKN